MHSILKGVFNDYVNDPIKTLCALAGSLRGPALLSEISLCSDDRHIRGTSTGGAAGLRYFSVLRPSLAKPRRTLQTNCYLRPGAPWTMFEGHSSGPSGHLDQSSSSKVERRILVSAVRGGDSGCDPL